MPILLHKRAIIKWTMDNNSESENSEYPLPVTYPFPLFLFLVISYTCQRMNNPIKIFHFILVPALIFLTSQVFAQRTVTIKMASQVPENTPWGEYFSKIAADWNRITNGEVKLIIYHNGTAGNEDSVVRNLRLNQLQAAVLSTFGLAEITPEIMTLSCPFFIRDDNELELVLKETKKELEDKLDAKGFITLAWAQVGWVKFFSKTPVFVPADLKRQKLGTYSEYEKLNQIFKTMGFQMVPVSNNEILIALNSPMVDAVYQSPIAVGGTQAFGLARNMASINVAPFMGAIIITRRAWNSIPEKYKPQMLEAVKRRELELDRAAKKIEEDMIKIMEQYGLKVNQLTRDQEQLWYNEVERALPGMAGTVFDKALYNRIEAILRGYRNRRR